MARSELRGLKDRSDGAVQLVVTLLFALAAMFSFIAPPPALVLYLVLGVTVLFLLQLGDGLIIAFPVALINPILHAGQNGFDTEELRSFHPITFNMTEVFLAFILVAWLMRGRQREGEASGRYLNVPLLGMLIVVIVGIFLARDRPGAIRIAFERYIEPLILFFIITHSRWDRTRLRRALGVFSAVVLFLLIRNIYLHYYGAQPSTAGLEEAGIDPTKGLNRLHGEWAATNTQAAFFTFLAPLTFLWTLYHPSRRVRFGSLVVFGWSMLAVALSYTRAAWLAMGLILTWISRRRKRAFALVAVVGILVVLTGTADMLRRGETLLDPMRDQSASNRVVVWNDTIDMIVHSMFMGIGLGTFMRTYHVKIEGNVHPHNDYLYITVEMGVLALFVFLVLLARIGGRIRTASRRSRDDLDRLTLAGLGAAIWTFLIQANFDCLLGWPQYCFALWYLLGIAAAYAQSVLEESSDGEARRAMREDARVAGRAARSGVEGTVPVAR